MRQTIPFRKDITLKTKIAQLTAISLDNDLELKGEDLIIGNFYISGSYKNVESDLEEDYSYKIPCEIAISDEYDTYDASIDIDDFYYEIIDDQILRINIVVLIDNLERKIVEEDNDIELIEELFDEKEEEKMTKKMDDFEIDLVKENIKVIEEIPEVRSNSFMKVTEEVKKQEEVYLTYRVYVFKEDDTIDKVLEKYNITLEQLSDYNNIDEIDVGVKLVIPSFND